MNRAEHAARPNRESLSKRLGKVARQIKARDGHCCVYCGLHADNAPRHHHLDHLIPRSQGGLDIPTNLVVACFRCNAARQDMSVAEFAAYAAVKFNLHFTSRAIFALAARALPSL